MTYSRIFIVDTENVQRSILKDLMYLDENELIILMDSSRTFQFNLQDLATVLMTKGEIHVEKVDNGTSNAMDFCIVSLITSMMMQYSADEFVIISNDKGYIPVVNMWNKRGLNVRLFKSVELLKFDDLNRKVCIGTDADNLQKVKNGMDNHAKSKKLTELDNKKTDLLESLSGSLVTDFEAYLKDSELDEVKTLAKELQDTADALASKLVQKEDIINSKDKEISVLSSNIKELENEINYLKNMGIDTIKEKVNSKIKEENKDKDLKEIEESILNSRDYNRLKLDEIYKFGVDKKNKIADLIIENANFKDVKESLQGIIKRNKYAIDLIEENWAVFRHE